MIALCLICIISITLRGSIVKCIFLQLASSWKKALFLVGLSNKIRPFLFCQSFIQEDKSMKSSYQFAFSNCSSFAEYILVKRIEKELSCRFLARAPFFFSSIRKPLLSSTKDRIVSPLGNYSIFQQSSRLQLLLQLCV